MITGYDYILAPIYLIAIYLFMYNVRNRITTKETRPYFFKALNLKMLGSTMLCIIFFYYYGYGDTLLYHELGTYMYNAFWYGSPGEWFELVFYPMKSISSPTNGWIAGNVFYLRGDTSTFFVVRVAGFLSIFCANSYFVIAAFCGVVSFFGAWAMFVTFTTIYPKMIKKFAIAVFYLPSVFFWGSGLMKDSLCFGALGLTFYGFYFAVIRRKNITSHAILAGFGMLVLAQIKIYILLCFIPMLAIWTYLQYLNNIKSYFLKIFLGPVIFIFSGVLGVFAVLRLSQNTEYSVDNLASKTKVTSTYLQNMSQQGSVYYIGEYDGTITGLLSYFPQAVSVALYRPFLWEAKNPFALLSAFEATYFLLFTFYVIFIKVRPANVIATFIREPIAPACLFFAMFFSFSVGITAGNFGTLVRYKIPMMPFYIASLMIMLESNRKKTVAEMSLELAQKREKEELEKEWQKEKDKKIELEQEQVSIQEQIMVNNNQNLPKFKIRI